MASAAHAFILAVMRWVIVVVVCAAVAFGCGGHEPPRPSGQEPASRSDEQLVRTLAADYFGAVDSGDTERFCTLLSNSTLKRISAATGADGAEGCKKAVSASRLSHSAEELGRPRVASVSVTDDRARLKLRTEQGRTRVAQVMTAVREQDGWKVERISAAEAPAGDEFAYRVPSEAMKPTFEVGDVVFVDPSAYKRAEPRYGDIVVFNPPPNAEAGKCADRGTPRAPCGRSASGFSSLKFIKRIVGLPGDEVAIRRGRVVRNGSPDTFEIKRCMGVGAGCDFPQTVRVPPKHYYVVGDNRGGSDDSRFWGPVGRSAILGRVADE